MVRFHRWVSAESMPMKRRKIIFGLGTAVAGGASLFGSGAFTSVEAERNFTVSVVQDSEAFLKMDAVGSINRSSAADTVRLDFPGLREGNLNDQDPDGINVDAVTRFSSEPGDNNSEGLLKITNQGTQEVDIYTTQKPGPGEPEIDLFNVETGSLLTEENPFNGLDIGNELRVGAQIDTTGVNTGEYDLVLTIVGEASGDGS